MTEEDSSSSADFEPGSADNEFGHSNEAPEADWIVHSPSQETVPPVSLDIDAGATVEWSEEDQSASLPYPVVGIGASAGGLQAFRELLESLPERTGMSYVFISHLAADRPSYLNEIFSRHTAMPVQMIEHGLRPERDHLYVLPPGQAARIEGGKFITEARDLGERLHFPIDSFLRSLSTDQKNYAVGVVLSGADSDGTLGMQAIKGEGGLTMVQSPETAEQRGMPLSSIALDHVDVVGSPAEIAKELSRLADLFGLPQIRSLEDGHSIPSQEQALQRILQILRNVTGLDLRQYKPETIRRRIARRMVVRRVDTLAEYARLLTLRPDEVRTLHEDALINVTRFFRDPEFWLSLSTQVLPALFQNRSPEKPLRIWCAGCSTGEEAYSFAIAVIEYLTANGLDSTIQIFGTDASENAIESARAAVYPESLMAEISPERLRRFFIKVDRGYQVSKRVRDCCIFARQNLAHDPPFSHIDLLSCRNVLIYFNQSLQKQMIATFTIRSKRTAICCSECRRASAITAMFLTPSIARIRSTQRSAAWPPMCTGFPMRFRSICCPLPFEAGSMPPQQPRAGLRLSCSVQPTASFWPGMRRQASLSMTG